MKVKGLPAKIFFRRKFQSFLEATTNLFSPNLLPKTKRSTKPKGAYKMTTDVAFDVQRQELVTKSGMDSKREAIVRTDTKEVIGVVSKSYKLIPHRELLEKVSQAIEEVGDFQLVKAEITKGGARLFS